MEEEEGKNRRQPYDRFSGLQTHIHSREAFVFPLATRSFRFVRSIRKADQNLILERQTFDIITRGGGGEENPVRERGRE